jgi:prolyl oligopeptidase
MGRNLYWFDTYVGGGGPPIAGAAPRTRTDNVKETLHGVEIVDPYRWLEDQKRPETRAWIETQQKYTQRVLAPLPGRDMIAKRLGELMKSETVSVPSVRGGRYFFSKRAADQDLPVFYVRAGRDGKDDVLLDCNTLSKDKSVSASPVDVSIDGKL